MELLFDLSLVKKLDGVIHIRNKPVFEATVLTNTLSIEGDNNGYYSIIKDNGEYKMYYRAQKSASYTALATSNDGVKFEKKGQILNDASVVHNFYPIKVSDKYIALGGSVSVEHAGINGVNLLTSNDGINWEKTKKLLDASNVLQQTTVHSYFDSLNIIQYDGKKYKIWLRYNSDVGVRSVQTTSTTDFITFTPAKEIVTSSPFSTSFSIYAINCQLVGKDYIAYACMQTGNNKDTKHVVLLHSTDGDKWRVVHEIKDSRLIPPFNAVTGIVSSVHGKKTYVYFQNITTQEILLYSYRYHGWNKLTGTGDVVLKLLYLNSGKFTFNLAVLTPTACLTVELWNKTLVGSVKLCTGGVRVHTTINITPGQYTVKLHFSETAVYSFSYDGYVV